MVTLDHSSSAPSPDPSLNADVPHMRAAPTSGPPVSLFRQASQTNIPIVLTNQRFMDHTTSAEDLLFQQSFEEFKVAPSDFDHAAHVRLAYIYLCRFPVEVATQRMRGSLLAFLDHLGVGSAKYHETVTTAWIMAVRHFMQSSPRSTSSTDFIGANPRLLDSKIMLEHYSAEVLFSRAARASFVQPDKAAIPEHD